MIKNNLIKEYPVILQNSNDFWNAPQLVSGKFNHEIEAVLEETSKGFRNWNY